MTSQISNVRTKQFCYRLMALTAFMFVFLCGHAQQGQPSMAQQLAALQRLEAMQPQKAADQSVLAMLHGFYYTAMIVMNPQQNGPRYYQQALDNFDKALKLNPNNEMAKQLQQQFRKGMEAQAKYRKYSSFPSPTLIHGCYFFYTTVHESM